MAEYLYGTYGHLAESVVQATAESSTVALYVGTAPVNLVRDYANKGIINAPVKIYNKQDAQKKIGYASDWTKYSLSEAVAAHFGGDNNVGPIFVINVLNPDKVINILEKQYDYNSFKQAMLNSGLQENAVNAIFNLYNEDMPWCYRLYSKLNSMVVLPDVTYIYEDNTGSFTNTTGEKIDEIVHSFCGIINYIQDNIYEKVWVDSMIYCYSILLRTMDNASRYGCSKSVRKEMNSIKRQLFYKALRSLHIFMALFFLTAFKPLSYVYKFSWVRKKYDKLAKIISVIENHSVKHG